MVDLKLILPMKQACYHYSDEKTTNKFAYKTSKKLIYSRFYFYCSCSKIIMAIETEMFRLLFLCHGKGVNLMELSMREKELLIMFGSERRLDTHKRLQNAIPYMTDSLYKASATALWNKLYNNISDESLMFLLAWYSIATTLFTAILSPVFLNDCITFFGTIGKGIINLFREFVTGADSFGQLSNGISNSIVSGIVYWLIVAIVMGILFIITGFLIIGIGYQVGKICRKYCWDIISIMVAIISTAIVIYFGEWIKSVIPINLIVLLLLVHVIYIGIRCYVKDWQEERGYY